MASPDKPADDAPIPPTQTQPKRVYKSFTLDEKRTILAEYAAAPDGQKGAVLRHHGLYHSAITDWTKALSGQVVARKDSKDREIEQLKADLARETLRAKKAEAMLDLQKKVAQVLESMQQLESTQK
jgi:hypothetical protein